ncbi:hypothetical protein OPV22_019722 [Ensete ventricosum]|uniref:RING-type domain-containing protein n=1 Tax=Ensete ventricosum TaxID=4639 RepID=A0AAV8QEL0_ENSVE|nr:hypothetical protein OPV22_019722 [Ensete ventricosum]
MAVQAQHLSNSTFSPDFRGWAGNDVMEELHLVQDQRKMLGVYTGRPGGVNDGTVFSDPKSELSCNASGPRKRPREAELLVALQQPSQDYKLNLESRLRYPNLTNRLVPLSSIAANVTPSACQQSRLVESGSTSTSGRPASLLTQDLVSHLLTQKIEIDALVRLQSERLRGGLNEAWRSRCWALLQGVEQHAAKRLTEKEVELEKALKRNSELEERIRQVSTEIQMWSSVAKNHQTVAANLQASLEHVLQEAAAAPAPQEGYGDTDDDAHSGCFAVAPALMEVDARRRRKGTCQACGYGKACVLLLPCRHLCLCKVCESTVDACPVCHSAKNCVIQVFIS